MARSEQRLCAQVADFSIPPFSSRPREWSIALVVKLRRQRSLTFRCATAELASGLRLDETLKALTAQVRSIDSHDRFRIVARERPFESCRDCSTLRHFLNKFACLVPLSRTFRKEKRFKATFLPVSKVRFLLISAYRSPERRSCR